MNKRTKTDRYVCYDRYSETKEYMLEMILDLLWDYRDKYDELSSKEQQFRMIDIMEMLWCIKREERLDIIQRADWHTLTMWCEVWEQYTDEELEEETKEQFLERERLKR